MIASVLKPSMNSSNGIRISSNDRRLLEHNKKNNLLKPIIASICFLLCIAVVPERPSNLASICEKYNSASACEVW